MKARDVLGLSQRPVLSSSRITRELSEPAPSPLPARAHDDRGSMCSPLNVEVCFLIFSHGCPCKMLLAT